MSYLHRDGKTSEEGSSTSSQEKHDFGMTGNGKGSFISYIDDDDDDSDSDDFSVGSVLQRDAVLLLFRSRRLVFCYKTFRGVNF